MAREDSAPLPDRIRHGIVAIGAAFAAPFTAIYGVITGNHGPSQAVQDTARVNARIAEGCPPAYVSMQGARCNLEERTIKVETIEDRNGAPMRQHIINPTALPPGYGQTKPPRP